MGKAKYNKQRKMKKAKSAKKKTDIIEIAAAGIADMAIAKKEKKKQFRCRKFVFTVSKPANPDWNPTKLVAGWKKRNWITYLRGQWESAVNEKTGQNYIHFQGFGQLSRRCQSRKKLLKELGFKGWVDVMHGTHDHNQVYCSKTDMEGKGNRLPDTEVFVMGKWYFQGRRTDVESMQAKLEAGATPQEIAYGDFDHWKYQHKAIDKYYLYVQEKRTPNWRTVTCECIWGDAGSGKSRKAEAEAVQRGGGFYRPIINSATGKVWWDGYTGQKNIIFDDFYGQIKFNWMLRLTDGYKLLVEPKGGSVYAQWTHVTFTSNVHPSKWWSGYQCIINAGAEKSVDGFRRRLKRIREIRMPKENQFTEWARNEVTHVIKRTVNDALEPSC